ncbi:MAG: hypothetical protein ACFN9G_05540 [Cardiobacterium sp.]|jgi:hypothetical protein
MTNTLRPFLALLALAASLGAQALQSYIAEYDLSVRGVGAGRMRHEAVFTERSYRVTADGTPSLAAKMLGFGQIREKAEGKIAGDRVIPTYYRRDMQGNDNQHISYDYANAVNGEIQAIVGAQNKTLRVNPNDPALDILALVVQSLLDVERGHIGEHNYTLINEDRVRSYQVNQLPDETWQDNKNGRTLKIKVFLQTSGNRQTKIYFAEEPLRLVKLQQLKDGESRFSLKLLNYKPL